MKHICAAEEPFACRAAMAAAEAIRAAIADPKTAGIVGVLHVDLARPRRAAWYRTWSNLPGLVFETSRRVYTHSLLPGWEYTVAEMKTEMLDDLDHLAASGERPKVATRAKGGA